MIPYMVLLQNRYLRAFTSLFLSMIAIYVVSLYLYNRNIAPVFVSELRGHTNIDFAACLSKDQEVAVQYGFAIYRLQRMIPGWCLMRYANVIETFHWDGQFTTTCVVPESFGTQTFAIRGSTIDLQPIGKYCFNNATLIVAIVAFIVLSIMVFLGLSIVGRLHCHETNKLARLIC